MFNESGSYWNPSSIIPKFSELTHLSCSGIIWEDQCCPAKPTLGSCLSHRIMPEQPEAQYFGAARSWHSALMVPPLPGECVGRLQLYSCLARGKERREMSPWIYLEPDFPPTASEGASGRARSQAREREVGEGDPGTREGCAVSDGLAGCPNTIHVSIFPLRRQLLPFLQGWEEPSRALQPCRKICFQAHLDTLGHTSCPFNCQKEVSTRALKIICHVISPEGPMGNLAQQEPSPRKGLIAAYSEP